MYIHIHAQCAIYEYISFENVYRCLKKLKFIYSEKAKIFCEISTADLSYEVMDKSSVEISQKFVAFSEYMNFKNLHKSHSIDYLLFNFII